jgi:hypothetical protein
MEESETVVLSVPFDIEGTEGMLPDMTDDQDESSRPAR